MLMFTVLTARFPRPRTVTLVTTKPVFGPPLQLGRVNSDELLNVRSVLITVTGDPGDNTTGDSAAYVK